MSKVRLLYIFLTILMLLPMAAKAQVDGSFTSLYPNENNMQLEEPLDTLARSKRTRPPKPLESYLFDDSLRTRKMFFSWTHNPYNNTINVVPVDTTLTNYQREYIFLQNNPAGVSYLGNLGAAVQPFDYSARRSNYLLSFMDPYNDYIFREENVRFYNGRLPYTNAAYYTSGQRQIAEEIFQLTHQQNIVPTTSINLSYRNNRTRGMYSNQQAINKNLSVALSHTGKRYALHTGYIFNSGDIQENGGLVRDSDVRDTLIDLPRNIEMQLMDARNRYKGNVFYMTQSLAVPLISYNRLDTAKIREVLSTYKVERSTSLFFGTSFKYSAYHKNYSDTYDKSNEGYYQHWYINPGYTQDSIREREMDIKLFAQLQPYNRNGVIGLLSAGVGYQNVNYSQFNPKDFLLKNNNSIENNLYIYADAQGQFREYVKWQADIRYIPIGHRTQDIDIGGRLDLMARIRKRPVTLSAGVRFYLQSPNYWQEHFYSNHFIWNNSFSKQTSTIFNINLAVPSWQFNIGAKQFILYNKIYYGPAVVPIQHSGTVSVTEGFLNKNFVIGGLHLEHTFLVQYSSDQEVVPVPLLAANLTYYYEFNIVRNVLRMQIGAELYYSTDFYGPGYNPAVGQFYNQRSVETGNYPFTNIYITAKWKRMRILLKYQHINYELYGGRDYMAAAHYPAPRGMFRYGISWSFYD